MGESERALATLEMQCACCSSSLPLPFDVIADAAMGEQAKIVCGDCGTSYELRVQLSAVNL